MKNNSAGFSLLETLIVATLSVMVIMAATSLFLMTMISSSKTNNISVVKSDGDYAIGQMEFLLRNAVTLLPNDESDPSSPVCQNGMSQIRFRSIDGGETTLFTETDNGSDKIASNSGIYLTSDSTILVDPPVFNCTQSPDRGVSTVEVNFTLGKGVEGQDRESELVEQEFRSTVTLRSF